MDATIQSLVQSPYMRAMAVVPTRSEELVHGIHDHLPPLVKTKVVVQPYSFPRIAGRWYFEIPRRGLWNSAVLIVRPNKIGAVDENINEKQRLHQGIFTEAITNIELYSKQRFIERLIPEAIAYEMTKTKPNMYTWMTYTCVDYDDTDGQFVNDIVPFPHIACQTWLSGVGFNDEARHPHFIIPLPLSCFSSIKKNFQTLFVETLNLVVTTKDFGFFPIDNYDMELHCYYHSFHPNVETVIRNANFKQSIPATLPWYDWIEFPNVVKDNAQQKITCNLDSDALISSIIVIPLLESTAFNVTHMKSAQNLYFVLTSASQLLFEGSAAMIDLNDPLILDETDAGKHFRSGTDSAFCWYFPLNLGLRQDNERFTGGLALSSLVTPVLTVYPSEMVYRNGVSGVTYGNRFPYYLYPFGSYSSNAFNVRVIAKRHYFLRIDSDTGVITRSIET